MNITMGKELKMSVSQMIASEPYRVFFPMAIIAGITGVLMWPLFYWGLLGHYPLVSHAHLMIEGLIGGFVIGFMGTALPKMLGGVRLKVYQVALMIFFYVSFCSCHFLGMVRLGDGLFFATLGLFVLLMLMHVKHRKATPPAVMLLAGVGMMSGLFGAAWLAFIGPDAGVVSQFAERLLYQAFILCPLLGVGSFLFPLISNSVEPKPKYSEEDKKRAWRVSAIEHLSLGLLLVLTYWVEVHTQTLGLPIVRAVFCSVYLVRECNLHKKFKFNGVMDLSLRAGVFCLILGLLLRGLIQQHMIALDHTLYIGGFGLIAIVVGSRVIYGHSGQEEKFGKWLKSFAVVAGLVLLAMATRVTADFIPRLMVSHHIYAAFCWILACVVWEIAILPSVLKKPSIPRKTRQEKLMVEKLVDLNSVSTKVKEFSALKHPRVDLFDERDVDQ